MNEEEKNHQTENRCLGLSFNAIRNLGHFGFSESKTITEEKYEDPRLHTRVMIMRKRMINYGKYMSGAKF